ncbi:MAG: GDSL family lipase [Clostridia bacterium]|nr:GDSL family lipase [Clostridia bacterium]
MKFFDKIKAKQNDRQAETVTIAFLGDSVTQGCFECPTVNEKRVGDPVFDVKSAYSTRVREILNILYPSITFDIINAGISGDNAACGLKRLHRDVISKSPDLVIVSYGLNDSTLGIENIGIYEKNIEQILSELKKADIDTIFLTENFMCTKTSIYAVDPYIIELSEQLAKLQNEGVLKAYFNAAKALCKKYDVKVCDLYSVWEKMAEKNVDTTELLSNYLNHPLREIHYYIAIKIIETIFYDFK